MKTSQDKNSSPEKLWFIDSWFNFLGRVGLFAAGGLLIFASIAIILVGLFLAYVLFIA